MAIAMHDAVSKFRMEDILQREGHSFIVFTVKGQRATHVAPAIAPGVIGGWCKGAFGLKS